MRPLTSEETATLRRRHLLPWQIAMGGGGAVALLFLLPMAISGARKGDWGDTWYLVIFLAAFFGAMYAASKPIRDDLREGLAESVTGPVERRWHGRNTVYIRIAGKELSLGGGVYKPAEGESVVVEFLPRSLVAFRVEKVG